MTCRVCSSLNAAFNQFAGVDDGAVIFAAEGVTNIAEGGIWSIPARGTWRPGGEKQY